MEKQNESIKYIGKIHWCSYLATGSWGLLSTYYILKFLFLTGSLSFILIFAGLSPLLLRYLTNKYTSYTITDKSLKIETGFLSISKKEIPLNKINDINLNQGIIQRAFKVGDIEVLTGNDASLTITNIENVEQFKEELASRISPKTID